MDLSCLETNFLDQITQRVLWRIAQSQCDPLGLLSVYMVKCKLLMRRVLMKDKSHVGKCF
jgi:hypothetical protein